MKENQKLLISHFPGFGVSDSALRDFVYIESNSNCFDGEKCLKGCDFLKSRNNCLLKSFDNEVICYDVSKGSKHY